MYDIFDALCKERGVTPYKVCKETGITTATISNWKAGRYVPKSDKMQIIADYFGVTLEYMFTGKNPETKQGYYLNDETASIAQEIFENKELRMLVNASRGAEPEDILAARDVLLALRRKEGRAHFEN